MVGLGARGRIPADNPWLATRKLRGDPCRYPTRYYWLRYQERAQFELAIDTYPKTQYLGDPAGKWEIESEEGNNSTLQLVPLLSELFPYFGMHIT